MSKDFSALVDQGLAFQRMAEQVADLSRLVDTLLEEVRLKDERIRLQDEVIRELREEVARLKRNSGNSSKPPSSDIAKPPKTRSADGKKRKIGGQPGHEKHERTSFPPGQIDEIKQLELSQCPDCGGALVLDRKAEPKVQQTVELPVCPVIVTEYQRPGFYCEHCKTTHFAPLPQGVGEGQLFGPRLVALTAFLKGSLHASYRGIQSFFSDALGLDVSLGLIPKMIQKASLSLALAYNELAMALRSEPLVHVDETGSKENGKRRWVWAFIAKQLSLFRYADTRSRLELDAVLEDFSGIRVSDFYPGYTKEDEARHQFCNAHLIRDIKFLTTLPDEKTRLFGEHLEKDFRALFKIWHQRDTSPKDTWLQTMQRILTRIRKRVDKAGYEGAARRLANRIRKYWLSIFRFVYEPDCPPTNNEAERALRHVAIDRRITQGTRGNKGKRWSERIWTARDTCIKQGRSLFDFLLKSLLATNTNTTPPTLLPITLT